MVISSMCCSGEGPGVPSQFPELDLPDIHLELADELGWTWRGGMGQAPRVLFACGFLALWDASAEPAAARRRLGQADPVLRVGCWSPRC